MATKEVPYHRLEFIDNTIIITKSNSLLLRHIFFSILIFLVFAIISWSVIIKSPDAFKKPLDAKQIVVLSFIGLIVFAYLYLRFRRFLRVITNFRLEKRDKLLINGSTVLDDSNSDTIQVVIQDVPGYKGIGKAYTIGLAKGKKFVGLCYGLNEQDAQVLATFIADAFGYKTITREAILFPLLKLH